jgi:hypothetical protein
MAELEHVFDYEAVLEEPLVIGGPFGKRIFYGVRGGRIDGPRVSGEILPGGGDWPLVDEKGCMRLDVRGQCRTDDEALLYFKYTGVLVDDYFRVAMQVETGDERYAWLTQSLLIGRGRITDAGVAYEVFRCA